MNASRTLGVMVVALAGAAAVLGHRLWEERKQLEALGTANAASRQHIESSEATPRLTAAANTAVATESARALPADSPPPASSKPTLWFRTLPSWLPVPHEKQELLFQLQDVLGSRRGFGTGASREAVEAGEQQNRDNHRQAREQIERLLGPALYPLWQEFHASFPVRGKVARMKLDPGFDPLPEDKLRVMAADTVRAVQGVEMDWQSVPGNLPDYFPPSTPADIDKRAEKRKRLAEAERDVAMRHLSRTQLQAFDKMQAADRTVQNESDAITKAMLKYDAATKKPGQ